MQSPNSEKWACLRFLLIFFGLVSLIVVSIRYLGSQTVLYGRGFDYQVQRFQREILEESNASQNRRNIVVLGDSTAARNLFFTKADSAVSLATFGGSLVDSYYLFNKYASLHPAPNCVVIMTSYGAFDYHAKQIFWPYLVKNGSYTLNELKELYEAGRSQNDFPGTMSTFEYGYKVFSFYDWLNGFNWDDLQNYLFRPELRKDAGLVYRTVKQNDGTIPVRWEVATKLAIPLWTPAEEHLKEVFFPRKTLDVYIKKLFSKLNSMNVRTIVLHAPIAEGLRTTSSEKWLSDYKQHMSQLIKDYPSVENHLQIEWFDNGNYFDGTHLLNFAAKKYTLSKEALFESCR